MLIDGPELDGVRECDGDAAESTEEFVPPSYATLFGNLLLKMPIRTRPPKSFCEMCVGGPEMEAELAELTAKIAGEVCEEEKDFAEWHGMGQVSVEGKSNQAEQGARAHGRAPKAS